MKAKEIIYRSMRTKKFQVSEKSFYRFLIACIRVGNYDLAKEILIKNNLWKKSISRKKNDKMENR